MIIQWYGHSCFKITSGDTVIAIDPYSKDFGRPLARFKANILLVTHSHPDHSYQASIMGDPFLVSSPGEFELSGTYIQGIETFHDSSRGKERGINTAYKIVLEDIRILHLGDFGEDEMRNETLDAIGAVDILCIPVGGGVTIDAPQAAKIIKKIEPRFVIPMHYALSDMKNAKLESVDAFLKEMGAGYAQPEEKLAIKKKDLGEDGINTKVVVLKPI